MTAQAPDDLPELTSPNRSVRVRAFMFPRTEDHHHRGIDLVAPKGTPVYSAAAGRVVESTDVFKPGFSGYGRVVVIHATDGTYHLYAHLDRTVATIGEHIPANSLIGYVGNSTFSRAEPTRESGGAHLHFEVSPTRYPQDSEAPRIDPVSYLRAGRIHPLRRTTLGDGTTRAPGDTVFAGDNAPEPKERRTAAGPLLSRCPCCGQPLPQPDGGADDNHG